MTTLFPVSSHFSNQKQSFSIETKLVSGALNQVPSIQQILNPEPWQYEGFRFERNVTIDPSKAAFQGKKPSQVAQVMTLFTKFFNGKASAAEAKKAYRLLREVPVDVSIFKAKLVRDTFYNRTYSGYETFMSTLEYLFGVHAQGLLHDKKNRWVGIEPPQKSFSACSPTIEAQIKENTPRLSLKLLPTQTDGQMITGDVQYNAPLFIQNVSSWGAMGKLAYHSLTRWFGDCTTDGHSEIFDDFDFNSDKKVYLKDIPRLFQSIRDIDLTIPETTPVVEVVSYVPISPNGEFSSEFVLNLSVGEKDHSHYEMVVVNQDKVGYRLPLLQGQKERAIKDASTEGRKEFNFKATNVLSMSSLEKLFVPGSAGEMFVIALPTKAPPPKPTIFGSRGGDSFDSPSWSRSMFGSGMKGGDFSRVAIGRGSVSGSSSLTTDSLESSDEGNPIIYHIKLIGFTPNEAQYASENFKP